ncbi:hypothetical protein FOZ61_011039 [Perkinsus olseni]|uniref:Major facilitator superfamily (MFS) profile domain-containing protein n=1 Tax=Perkinsus olseni TaxID=32597 RepID=A0A7J6M1F4_PEROL|nr:hypothetical protein FOZ61_011039 [Perkinsus olseni]
MSAPDAPHPEPARRVAEVPSEPASGGSLRRKPFAFFPRFDNGPRFFLDLFIVYVSVIVDFMGYTLLAPLFTTIVDELGNGGFSDDFAASWLMAMYGFGQFLSAMTMGPLSDLVGRRPVFVCAYSLTAAVYLIQGFSNSYWMFACLRLCNGLTTGTRPVAFSYLGDIAAPERMALYSTLVGVMIAIGSLMPLLGGSMGTLTWRLPVFFAAGLTFCMALLALIFLRESRKPDTAPSTDRGAAVGGGRPESSGIMRTPLFIVTLTMIALTGACVQFDNITIITTLPWLLNEVYGMALNTVGLVLGSMAIPTLITLIVIFLPLSKRLSMPILAMIGMLGHATMFILPLLNNVYGVIFLSYLLNFGNSMVYSSVPVMAKIIAPAPRRGLVNGIVLAAMLLAGAVGPLIAGVLWDVDSEHITAFAVVSVVAAVGALCMLFAWRLIPRLMMRRASSPQHDLTDKEIEDLYEELAELKGTKECRCKLAEHIKRRREIAHEEDAAVKEALRATGRLSLSELEFRGSVRREEDIWRLGHDVSAILDRNNWNRWPYYYEWVLAQIGSAFPPIREGPECDRFEDVTWVMQKHLEIVSEWEKRQLSKFKKDR